MTAAPPADPPWDLAFLRARVENQWKELRAQVGVSRCDELEERLVQYPRQRTNRNHGLRGPLRTKTVRGRTLDRWEYEFSSGGRIRYLIDDEKKTILIEQVFFGHPSDTK